ncbi:MAG: putative glycoside hydrolase, partial [Halanaerobiales bacterium]
LYHVDSKDIIQSEMWVNPFRKTIWEYNVQVAKDAIEMGFDEIQFDYIRYPAQTGLTLQPLIPEGRAKTTIINDFSDYVLSELAEYNIPVSIDVFGMTTTVKDDLGIGQDFRELAEKYNIISPMIYPSHYSNGIYGIENPTLEPYKLIYRSLSDALKKIDYNEDIIIRPWLQDFTLNDRYTHNEVLEQIKAVEDLGIKEWLLWNPGSNYQKEALIRSSY